MLETTQTKNNMTTENNSVTVSMTTEQTGLNGTNYIGRDEDLAKAEIVILATILYIALLGNTIVLVVLKFRHQKLTRMEWFIAHLAIADLFVALGNVLPQLIWDITEEFHAHDVVCRIVALFQVVVMCASSFVLVTTAIDRYLSICHPLISQTLSPSRVHQMIALAWTLSVILSLPQVYIFRLVELSEGSYNCVAIWEYDWSVKAYVTYVFVVIYAVPFLLLAFCYGRICFKVWASMAFKESSSSFRQAKSSRTTSSGHKSFRLRVSFRRMQDQRGTAVSGVDGDHNKILTPPRKSRNRQTFSKAKVKTVKMTLTVVLTYLVCWAPFFFSNMANLYGGVDFENTSMTIFMLLGSLNSCTNPWICLAFMGRVCPRKIDRRTSRSYAASTQMTLTHDTMENGRDSSQDVPLTSRDHNVTPKSRGAT